MKKMSERIILALVLALVFIFALKAEEQVNPVEISQAKIEKVRKEYTGNLAKLGLKPEDLQVVSIGKSHIDAAWLWHWYQTRDEKCPATFSAAILHSRQYPGFTYNQSSGQYYEWVKEVRPDLFQEIKQAEKDGRWNIVGGMWVEPDGNMPEGESFVRQFFYGQRFYLENFGHLTEVAWMEDSFGYNWNLPQVASKSGIKYMFTAKPTWNGHNLFPFHLFRWQSPDGTSLLTHISLTVGWGNYFPFNEYAPALYPDYFLSKLSKVDGNSRDARYRETRLLLNPGAKLTANYLTTPAEIKSVLSKDLITTVGVFYGKGDGGHGPVPSEIEEQMALAKLGYAKIGSSDQLFRMLEKYSDRIPTWNDEMYFEYHQGVFTTHEWIKRANRGAESLMRTAEAAASGAFLFGAEYPGEKLTRIWKVILLNQFHDILPGSSIPEVYLDSEIQHQQAAQDGNQVIVAALDSLSSKINTAPAKEGLEPILVFNPLGWARADVVKYPVKGEGKFQVFDRSGKELRSQAVVSEQGESDIYFQPDSIPALGWETFYLKSGEACAMPGPVVKESADRIVIETDLIRVAIDKKTGLMVSLFDRRAGRETLKAPSNKIVAYLDQPREYPAWNLAENYLTKPIPVPEAASVKIDSQGPVLVRVLVDRKGKPTSFKQWITVFSGSPLVNLITWSDMHWKDSITKVEFNTAVETDQVAAEIPYAVIERSTHPTVPWDQARTEMPMEKWADLSNKNFGVSLINYGKYAICLTEDGQGLRVSIVKNAKYPTAAMEAYQVNPMEKIIPGRETDAGEHWAHLAIMPHPGDWKSAKVYRAGYEYNTPVVVLRSQAHPGSLPAEMSLLSLESESAFISQVKKAEDDGDLVVRIVEGEGRDTGATLKVNPIFKIKGAAETDLLELNPKPLKAEQNSLTIPVGHFEIKTVKIGLGLK